MKPTIVVLDDHTPTLEILTSVVSNAASAAGAIAAAFFSDVEAEKYVRDNSKQILGYVQDLYRAGSEGTSLAGVRFFSKVLDRYTPDARVVIHSGYLGDESTELLRRAGGNRIRFIGKHEPGGLFPKLAGSIRWLLEPRSDVSRSASARTITQIETVRGVWLGLLERAGNDSAVFDGLTSRDFEKLVAELFRREGWVVELTARTRDGGYDIVAIKERIPTGLKLLIEAKRYSPETAVGVGVVRSLYGLRGLHSASQVVLATSSFVSADAKREFSRVVPWELDFLERDRLSAWCRTAAEIELGGVL